MLSAKPVHGPVTERAERGHRLAGGGDIHPGAGESECRGFALGVHRTYGQHVVVVPGRTHRNRDAVPGYPGGLRRTLRGAAGIAAAATMTAFLTSTA